jgi:MoaA/NifB/PqqE/SkfB family radical SAM enzyme
MRDLRTKLTRLIDSRSLLQKEPRPLCAYPFMNVMLTADGRYKPCCKWTDTLCDNGKVLRVPDADLHDAFHSSVMEELRQRMREGERHSGCKVCWDEDDSGVRSMRFDSFGYAAANPSVWNDPALGRLDIYPGNICNLMCRICSPHYSSRWIDEARETQGIQEEVHMNLDARNLSLIEQWLPNIEEIGLFGGEPLYLKETSALLHRCVDLGHSERIRLLINTNGTVYSEQLMALFTRFSKVLLNFSIDDLVGRFEYQRKGARWDSVVSNVDRYVREGGVREADRVQCKICCTVSAVNVFYLPEFLEWVTSRYPGMEVFLNILHGPHSLSVRNLPNEVKDRVRGRLEEYSAARFHRDTTFPLRDVQNIIDFIGSPAEQPVDLFMREVERGDRYRRESFAEVFPEYHECFTALSVR